MLTNTSDRGQNVQPRERDLINLHKKVINTVFITLYSNLQGNYTKIVLILVFQVISAVQRHSQTQVQWSNLLEEVFHLEDVTKSKSSSARRFIRSSSSAQHHNWIRRFFYPPTVGEFSNLKEPLILIL